MELVPSIQFDLITSQNKHSANFSVQGNFRFLITVFYIKLIRHLKNGQDDGCCPRYFRIDSAITLLFVLVPIY